MYYNLNLKYLYEKKKLNQRIYLLPVHISRSLILHKEDQHVFNRTVNKNKRAIEMVIFLSLKNIFLYIVSGVYQIPIYTLVYYCINKKGYIKRVKYQRYMFPLSTNKGSYRTFYYI